MIDYDSSKSTLDEELLATDEDHAFHVATKGRLGQGNDPYELLDGLKIPRDHPFLLAGDKLREWSRQERQRRIERHSPKT